MQPLVSVVIPCFGQAHFLEDAIESVLAQTHLSHELIVVNDGSPDTVALEQVLSRFPKQVTYVRQENRGLGAARNSGLKLSSGELVVCLDADDRLLPGALSTGVDALSAHPDCALVWGLNQTIDAMGRSIPYSRAPIEGVAGYAELLKGNFIGPPVGVMFRRAALLAIGGFSVTLPGVEDYDVYLQLARAHGIYCHGHVIAEYRRHGANMSRDYRTMLAGTLHVLDRQLEWVDKAPDLRMAMQVGRRRAREEFDWNPRIKQVYAALRDREWRAASMGSAALFIRYPVKSASLVGRRLRRALSQAAA